MGRIPREKPTTEAPAKSRGGRPKKESERDLAFLLYMNTDKSMEQIAEIVNVRPNTVGRWAAQDGWELIRSANAITRKNQVRNHLLQLADLNREIMNRESGKRYPTIQEGDLIAKLTKSIETLDKQANLSDYVTVFEQFFIFLRHAQRGDMLKEVEKVANEFIQMKAEELR